MHVRGGAAAPPGFLYPLRASIRKPRAQISMSSGQRTLSTPVRGVLRCLFARTGERYGLRAFVDKGSGEKGADSPPRQTALWSLAKGTKLLHAHWVSRLIPPPDAYNGYLASLCLALQDDLCSMQVKATDQLCECMARNSRDSRTAPRQSTVALLGCCLHGCAVHPLR